MENVNNNKLPRKSVDEYAADSEPGDNVMDKQSLLALKDGPKFDFLSSDDPNNDANNKRPNAYMTRAINYIMMSDYILPVNPSTKNFSEKRADASNYANNPSASHTPVSETPLEEKSKLPNQVP
jgi:hypothetical protein